MTDATIPAPEELHNILSCDPETGSLTWKFRSAETFSQCEKYSPQRMANSWNTRNAYKPALTARKSGGYFHGSIHGKIYLAHRIIFAMFHGNWPVGEIDHINGIRDDNRIVNLRDVTHDENTRNAAMPKTNTSGNIGVYWIQDNGKWRATISVRGKSKHIGYFTCKSDAIAARAAAGTKYGFHKNHGRD